MLVSQKRLPIIQELISFIDISATLPALHYTVLYVPYDLEGEPGGKSKLSLCSLQGAEPDRARPKGGREYPPTDDTESVTWWREQG